jgi:malate dehydrogenase (oxaloacetate-decarboxylating)(NADP+)
MEATPRALSLPKSVAALGMSKWNQQPDVKALCHTVDAMCQATTVVEAVAEIKGIMSLGHNLWAYAYLRALSAKNVDLYYGLLLAEPALLLPVAYTPTVGEACQKFGRLPFYPRGCYVSISDRGNVKGVLKEYAEAMLKRKEDNAEQYDCQCIVFSDGGRILGLGDLGTFGMGIPLGKLDLYAVCGGFNPAKTIPVIIDAGCTGPEGNSAGLVIRDSELYTGLKQDRVTHKSEAGTIVNSAYYGADSFIGEFMTAASELFGTGCLLQFEDFNSNDAFPLLAEYRDKYLTYNDDIQGTAAVTVAALLGGIKIQKPACTSLVSETRSLRFLFHGAGSANIGSAMLLLEEAGVPKSSIFITNSTGLIWKSEDGKEGNFKNGEQKAVAMIGKPDCGKDLVSIVNFVKPSVLIGAVGRNPGCFTEEVMKALLEVQPPEWRPIVFALSNPKTQAEMTAEQCYKYTGGKAIFGSGTRFEKVQVGDKMRDPGQVNNCFIFPGMSFGAMCCEASTIPEKLFMVAAEAVANCLDARDIDNESVVPHPDRLREVGHAVALAVVMEAQASGLARKYLTSVDASKDIISEALKSKVWSPSPGTVPRKRSAPAIEKGSHKKAALSAHSSEASTDCSDLNELPLAIASGA